jgi:transglutaminase-like putative cysteine protease
MAQKNAASAPIVRKQSLACEIVRVNFIYLYDNGRSTVTAWRTDATRRGVCGRPGFRRA